LTWERKADRAPQKGLTLVQDTTNSSNTFTILAVDGINHTITVNGIIDATSIDPAYTNPVSHLKNSATCNTFGLIFGQLIKHQITSAADGSARSIKFFDPTLTHASGKVGGYVDPGTARQGKGGDNGCHLCGLPQLQPDRPRQHRPRCLGQGHRQRQVRLLPRSS